MRITEHLTEPAQDWLVCPCGNEPYLDGFYPCGSDGTMLSPDINGDWDSVTHICSRCSRIFDTDTLLVSGIASEQVAFANHIIGLDIYNAIR